MPRFKVFSKQRRGMPLVPARDLGRDAHAVQNSEFVTGPAALEFVQTIVKQCGEAILLTAGEQKIATGLALERLAFGR